MLLTVTGASIYIYLKYERSSAGYSAYVATGYDVAAGCCWLLVTIISEIGRAHV